VEAHRKTRAFCAALRVAYAKHPLGNKEGPRPLPGREKLLQTTEGKKGGGPAHLHHIWAYALYERVPTGVFQIISHLISKFEHEADHGRREIDGTHDDAFRTVAGLYALLNHFVAVFPLDADEMVTDQHVRELLDAFHRGASEFDRNRTTPASPATVGGAA
jgi:hypothetical protein